MTKQINVTRISIVFMLLIGAMLISVVPCGAVEPRYMGVSVLTTDFSISGNGKATCESVCTARNGYTVELTIELEQKTGNTWETICTWSEEGTKISFEKSIYVVSGYDYRLKVSADVRNGNGTIIESPVAYSNEVPY